MKKGIAVLLQGSRTDLAASLQGIELARRTASRIHGLLIDQSAQDTVISQKIERLEERLLKRLQFVGRLCDKAGIEVNWHILQGGDREEPLLEFLRSHSVCCLVVGAPELETNRERMRWLADLPKRLSKDSSWFQLAFWVLEAKPWNEAVLDRTLEKWVGNFLPE